jgi:hypothetical protein
MLHCPLIARIALLFLFGVVVFAPDHAVAGNQQGAACPGGAVAPIVNSANDDGNALVCISGTWQYPSYAFQTGAASAGSSCTGYPTGAMRYNSTLTNMEFCDGTNWRFLAASTTSCGSPSGLSFTNLTSQSLSTSVNTLANPATITFSGCSGGGLSVSVSGAATAQISINGGAWVTSGAITSGQTLNVRMTTSSSASTVLTATVTVGGSSTNWTTTTRSGSLKIFVTANTYLPGGLGGLSGADAVCQSEAGTAGYAGTYKAILSDATTSAVSRLTLSYPVVNAYNGTTVSAANLWNGSFSNIILRPNGSSVSFPSSSVTSGSTVLGGISGGGTCTSWSASGSVEFGTGGTGADWLDYSNYGGYGSCTTANYLYCIQQ